MLLYLRLSTGSHPGRTILAPALTVLVIRMALALVFGLGLLVCGSQWLKLEGQLEGYLTLASPGPPARRRPRATKAPRCNFPANCLQIACALFCTCNAGLDTARNCRHKITRSINLRPGPMKHRAVIS